MADESGHSGRGEQLELELLVRAAVTEIKRAAVTEVKELEAQVTLALAALGVAFAQTLVELAPRSEALVLLRQRAEAMEHHLDQDGSQPAAAMIGTFVRSLFDKRHFPGEPPA